MILRPMHPTHENESILMLSRQLYPGHLGTEHAEIAFELAKKEWEKQKKVLTPTLEMILSSRQ